MKKFMLDSNQYKILKYQIWAYFVEICNFWNFLKFESAQNRHLRAFDTWSFLAHKSHAFHSLATKISSFSDLIVQINLSVIVMANSVLASSSTRLNFSLRGHIILYFMIFQTQFSQAGFNWTH